VLLVAQYFYHFANIESNGSNVLKRAVARLCKRHYGWPIQPSQERSGMLSTIFIALLQTVAGDPATAAATEPPATEAPAAATDAAPRTERRRVCRTYEAATGGRLSQRRCRYVDVPVNDGAADDAAGAAATTADSETADTGPGDERSGGSSQAASPSPASPQ
jgi:hypothetical protein